MNINKEEPFTWKLLGYILLTGWLGLATIFLILVLFNVASFFNYSVNGYFIGGVASLLSALLIYKLSNRLVKSLGG